MRSARGILGTLSLALAILAATALFAVSGVNVGADDDGGRRFSVGLSGDQEVAPAIGDKASTPGADGIAGSGVAELRLRPGKRQICYAFRVANIQLPAAAAHIHRGAAGTNGPVVVNFNPPGADGTSAGCVAVERSLIREIIRNPAGFYVNVHTPEFSAGALRGQLSKQRGGGADDD